MASFDFPASPFAGQEHDQNGMTFIWSGKVWNYKPPDYKTEIEIALDRKVSVAGDNMLGPLGLPYGDPVMAHHAVPKHYVDRLTGGIVFTTDAPPTGIQPGTLWWESDTGFLYIYYDDGDSKQWVMVTGSTGTPIGNDAPMNGFVWGRENGQWKQPVVQDVVGLQNELQNLTEYKVFTSGDTMTGPLNLQMPLPTGTYEATHKQYVDASIAAAALYQGVWQVATNVPDLITAAPLHSYSWIANTVDPNVGEVAPAGIPGIGGQTITASDNIIWNDTLQVYERVRTPSAISGEYLPLIGGTMTGAMVMTGAAGLHWDNNSDVANGTDFSKGICLYGYGTTSQFGFTVTSGTLNYVVQNVGNRHNFWCGTVNALKIEDQGSTFTGSIDASGHIQSTGGGIYSTGGNFIARNGSAFKFETDDGNAWRNALNCGAIHLQYIVGGNNDGRFRMWTANGGYSDNWVLETTIVNGLPGINVNGSVKAASGGPNDNYGLFIGDAWHGWVWSNTSNCEHLRSYQGKWEFRKTNAVTPGELCATIDTAAITTNMFCATAPQALTVAKELDVTPDGDGVDVVKMLAACLAKINKLEARLAELEGA